MPQLYSRMDDMNWLTPSIADILSQGATPPGGDGSIREQMLSLQKRLEDLETPARVINVRPTPSYTLFITKPEAVGRLGARRTVAPNEIRRSLARIAEDQKDWRIGYLPEISEVPDTFGILVRTQEHRPISLRRLLVRSAFRNHPSTMTFAPGVTLEQKLVLHDLSESGNLLIAGEENSKQHLTHNLLLTLISLNTPGELRVAIAGRSSEVYKPLVNIPHALGRLLASQEEGQRLIDGLVKELGRRQDWLESEGVDNIAEYNASIREAGKTALPRIVLLIDSLSDDDWQATRENWIDPLVELLRDEGKSGIHLVLSANTYQTPDTPGELDELLPVKIITRSLANDITDQITNFHGSLMRFVDAFVVDETGEDVSIRPIEVCNITSEEIRNSIAYWHQATKQRSVDTQEEIAAVVSGRTGVTGILKAPPSLAPQMEPLSPVPDEPRMEDIRHATIPMSQVETDTEAEVEGASALLDRAQALSAYLGWIGAGPLVDILGLSLGEAHAVIMT